MSLSFSATVTIQRGWHFAGTFEDGVRVHDTKGASSGDVLWPGAFVWIAGTDGATEPRSKQSVRKSPGLPLRFTLAKRSGDCRARTLLYAAAEGLDDSLRRL